MPAGYDPSEVPVYRDREARDEEYERAKRSREPFFAIEQYEDGFAITYDLLPAGRQLTTPARQELDERLTRAVEDIVADADDPTTEVTRSVGESLGSISFFAHEDTAREVAAAVSRIALDRDNWVEARTSDTGSTE